MYLCCLKYWLSLILCQLSHTIVVTMSKVGVNTRQNVWTGDGLFWQQLGVDLDHVHRFRKDLSLKRNDVTSVVFISCQWNWNNKKINTVLCEHDIIKYVSYDVHKTSEGLIRISKGNQWMMSHIWFICLLDILGYAALEVSVDESRCMYLSCAKNSTQTDLEWVFYSSKDHDEGHTLASKEGKHVSVGQGWPTHEGFKMIADGSLLMPSIKTQIHRHICVPQQHIWSVHDGKSYRHHEPRQGCIEYVITKWTMLSCFSCSIDTYLWLTTFKPMTSHRSLNIIWAHTVKFDGYF